MDGMRIPLVRDDSSAVTTTPTTLDDGSSGDRAPHHTLHPMLRNPERDLQDALRCRVRPCPDRRRASSGPDEREPVEADAAQDLEANLM